MGHSGLPEEDSDVATVKCPRCNVEMGLGKAFVSGSYGCFGPRPRDSRLCPVLKCPECGHSDDDVSQLDKVINAILAEERMKAEPPPEEPVRKLLFYRCEEDGYDVLYSEDDQEAVYRFDGQHGTVEHIVVLAQRNYYVDIAYWRLVAEPQKA